MSSITKLQVLNYGLIRRFYLHICLVNVSNISGDTSHTENGPSSDMQGMLPDNFDDKRADERFYSSPTPLLDEG